jgi:AraC-like DNA-binding protein
VLELTSELVAHVHSDANISFWLSGAAAQLSINDKPVGHDAESAVLINSLVPHSLKLADSDEPAHTLSFYLDPDWLRQTLPPHLPADFVHLAVTIAPAMREELWRLADMLLDESADAIELDCALMAFLRRALGACRAPEAPARPRAPRDFRLRKAVTLMRENMSRDLDMETVARASGLSRPHFFSIFRDQLDLTPAIYWNALRLEEAVCQMRDTAESLTTVASNLGFTAQGNFTRFFRQHTGVAPSAYRGALERERHAAAPRPRASRRS